MKRLQKRELVVDGRPVVDLIETRCLASSSPRYREVFKSNIGEEREKSTALIHLKLRYKTPYIHPGNFFNSCFSLTSYIMSTKKSLPDKLLT